MSEFEKKTQEEELNELAARQQQMQTQMQTQQQQTQAQILAAQQQAALQQQANTQTASGNDERRDRLDVARGDNTYVGVGINHMTKDYDLYLAADEGLGTDYHYQTSILGSITGSSMAAASGALFGDLITGNAQINTVSVLNSLNNSGQDLSHIQETVNTLFSGSTIRDNFAADSSGFSRMTNQDAAIANLFEVHSDKIVSEGRLSLSADDAKIVQGNSAWAACMHTDKDGSNYISFDSNQRDAVSRHMSWQNDLNRFEQDTRHAVNEFTKKLYQTDDGQIKLHRMDNDTMQRAVSALGITSVKDELKKDAEKNFQIGNLTEAEYNLRMKGIADIRSTNQESGLNGREGRKVFRERLMEHGLKDRDGSDFAGEESEKAIKNARMVRQMKEAAADAYVSGIAATAASNKAKDSNIFGKESEKADSYKRAREDFKKAYTSESRHQAKKDLREAKASYANEKNVRKRRQKDESDKQRMLRTKSEAEKKRIKNQMDRRNKRVERENTRRSERVRRQNDRDDRRQEGVVGKYGRLNDKIHNSRVTKGLRRISGKVNKVLHPYSALKTKAKRELIKAFTRSGIGKFIMGAFNKALGALMAYVAPVIAVILAVALLLPFVLGFIGFLFGGDVNSEDGGVNDMEFYQQISDALASQELEFINTAQDGATAALKAEGNSEKVKQALNNAGVKTYKDFDPVIEKAVTRNIYDEYGNIQNNMSTTIPILTMTKYRIVNGLGDNNVEAAVKYATYLWGGDKDFDSSAIVNPDRATEVTGVGEKAYITSSNDKNFTYASWSADAWSGPNHQIKYHAMPGDVTIDFSTSDGFMSYFTKDNTCAIQGEHHDDIDMCSAPQYHGSTENGIEHVMKALNDDCDNYHAIQGDLKEGVVVHKHTPGKKQVSAAYDEKKTTGKGKNKKTETIHHEAVYVDVECTDENCPGYEHYDIEIYARSGQVCPVQWHSEADPGDYNTWYVCDGHCPGHLTPTIDYAYISDFRNLAATDNKNIRDCLSTGERLGGFLSSIFSLSSDKKETDLTQYADKSAWNHWDNKDVISIRDFIGERTDNYKRGEQMYEKLGVEIKFLLANGMTSEDYNALLESVKGVVGPGGRDPGKTQQMLSIAASRLGRAYIWGGKGGDNVAGWDCSGFVTSAIIGAWGMDPSRGVDSYVKGTAHIRSWPGTGALTSESQLKAGSILVNGHHVIFVYPNGDGTYNTLEAESSATGCVSRHRTWEYLRKEYPLVNNDWAS